MTKKKTMKNINTPNKFWDGGKFKENFRTGFNEAMNLPDGSKFKDMFSAANMGKSLGAALPGMVGTLGGVAGGLISDGFSTTGGQVLSGIGDAAMMFNPIIGGAIKAASGLVNRAFGTKWNQEGIAKAENNISSLNNFMSSASGFDELMNDINSMNNYYTNIKASDLGKDGWLVNRTENKENELNASMTEAYKNANRSISNTSDNIKGDILANLERNYAAFGGPLFAYGGQTHGADFTNGLMFINNGGTHESNPYEGVPISMDQEGNPNLVEEGEVIWNDYVFSNRLKVPKSIQKKYKLGKKGMTFANAVDKLSKESEERPNDPISIKGLENILMNMAMEQETTKSKNNKNNKNNKFTEGGSIEEQFKLAEKEVDQELEDLYKIYNIEENNNLPTWMRYAPVVGHAASAINNIFTKPDYSTVDSIISTARNLKPNLVKFSPIGDRMTYTPFDTSFSLNNMRAQNAASRRAAINLSGGNRAIAMSNLLALDRQAQDAEGTLYQKALESNLAQKQKVAEFNKAVNEYNAEGLMRAALANQSERSRVRDLGLETLLKGYALKNAAKEQKSQAVSHSLSGLFQSLGDIGYENFAMNQINWGKKKGTYAPGSEDYNHKG